MDGGNLLYRIPRFPLGVSKYPLENTSFYEEVFFIYAHERCNFRFSSFIMGI